MIKFFQQKIRNACHKIWIYLLANDYTRERYFASKITYKKDQLRAEGYYGQYGQDKYVAESLYSGDKNKVFVDIGAHDGVSFSNSHALEKKFGWNGIAVEPNPNVFQRLKNNRQCHLYEGCISDKEAQLEFQTCEGETEMLSGLVDQYDQKHIDRINSESSGTKFNIIKVESIRLENLLKKFNINEIDYLSIDTEGSELAILSCIDFSKCTIRVIGIENNYHDKRIYDLLKKAGYRLIAITGCDEFYKQS